MIIKPNKFNPYSRKRTLPVGQLSYILPKQDQEVVDSVVAMLEFGEKELIYDLPRLCNPTSDIANLGCSTGGSATLFALGLKRIKSSSKIYTVDTYPDRNMSKACAKFRFHNVENNINVCQGKTSDFYQEFSDKNKKFKIIFIDADHSYEGVLEDFLNYSKLLVSEGVMAFHDTNQDYTNKVIAEHLKEWTLLYWVNRIKVFKR
jgi:predicted O-methyltransferase YrrM